MIPTVFIVLDASCLWNYLLRPLVLSFIDISTIVLSVFGATIVCGCS